MRLLIKTITFALVFICTFSCTDIYSSASEIDGLRLVDELDINTDFSVTISNTYTENKCIEQADANENGDFATLTRYDVYAQDDNRENVFLKKFVDIFNSNGEFMCELIFITKSDPILRMSGNNVYIIFNDTALVFDVVSREIKYYSINPYSVAREPEGTIKQGTEFTVGKWQYKLSKHQSLGYRQLTRSADGETHILIDLPLQFDYGYLLTIFCVGLSIFMMIRKRKKKISKKKEAGKSFTIDGFHTIDDKGRIH